MRHFLLLKDFVLENKWRYIAGILWMLVIDIVQMITPRIIGDFTDQLRAHNASISMLILYASWIAGIGVFVAVGRYSWRMYIMGTGRKLEYALRNRFYQHLQTLSPNYFAHHKTGDLMAHATNDLNAIRMAMGPGVLMLFDPIFLMILTLGFMLKTAGMSLTFWSLLPLPIMAIVTKLFGKTIHQRFMQVQEAFSELTDKVQENIAGVRVVKSFVQEQAEIEKFTRHNERNFQANLDMARVQGIFNPLVTFISTISFLIALSYGGIMVITEKITLGEFVAFNSYLAMLTWPMMAIGFVLNLMQRGAASLERLGKIFAEKPEIYDRDDCVQQAELTGEIVMDRLTFTYPNSKIPALCDISLRIPSGSTIGIVGRTGSGKTTLVNLLLRLYPIGDGQIFLDEYDINQVPLQVLRKEIGYVPQDNFLFSKTIRENIAFSDPALSFERVQAAAKLAQVHDNILEFPANYETLLGERGVTLSGGQKQRVSIARAISKDPKILILDDSLSAVDTQTEEKILEQLRDVMKTRTSIIIAHRISSIRNADQIVVLDDGRIVEQGTHDQLLALNGIYFEMYQKQLLEDEIASGE